MEKEDETEIQMSPFSNKRWDADADEKVRRRMIERSIFGLSKIIDEVPVTSPKVTPREEKPAPKVAVNVDTTEYQMSPFHNNRWVLEEQEKARRRATERYLHLGIKSELHPAMQPPPQVAQEQTASPKPSPRTPSKPETIEQVKPSPTPPPPQRCVPHRTEEVPNLGKPYDVPYPPNLYPIIRLQEKTPKFTGPVYIQPLNYIKPRAPGDERKEIYNDGLNTMNQIRSLSNFVNSTQYNRYTHQGHSVPFWHP